MPKMCERGYAQNLLCKTGNIQEQEVKGHVQLKGRAMPKMFDRGYAGECMLAGPRDCNNKT